MTIALYVCTGVAISLLLVSIGWRFFPRRRALPCPPWLAWLVEFDDPFVKSYNARTIIDRIDVQPGMKILDVGCGPGRLTVPAARKVGLRGEVVAIDIQAGMLRRAQEKAQAAHLTNVQFLQMGIGERKLDGDQYDRALMVTVLGEIPDRQGALQEIYDALKPGGILSVTEIVFDPHYQSRATVIRLASSAGFQVKSFFGNRLAFTLNLEKPKNS